MKVPFIQEKQDCVRCEATGKLWQEDGWDGDGTTQVGKYIECPDCGASGRVDLQVNVTKHE